MENMYKYLYPIHKGQAYNNTDIPADHRYYIYLYLMYIVDIGDTFDNVCRSRLPSLVYKTMIYKAYNP